MLRLPADRSRLIHKILWLGDLASIFALHNILFTILHSLLECPCVTNSVIFCLLCTLCDVGDDCCTISNSLAHLNNVICTNDRIICIIFRHIFDQLVLFILSFSDFC